MDFYHSECMQRTYLLKKQLPACHPDPFDGVYPEQSRRAQDKGFGEGSVSNRNPAHRHARAPRHSRRQSAGIHLLPLRPPRIVILRLREGSVPSHNPAHRNATAFRHPCMMLTGIDLRTWITFTHQNPQRAVNHAEQSGRWEGAWKSL